MGDGEAARAVRYDCTECRDRVCYGENVVGASNRGEYGSGSSERGGLARPVLGVREMIVAEVEAAMETHRQRERRKKNVMVFGLKEVGGTAAVSRSSDLKVVFDVFRYLGNGAVRVDGLSRVGKRDGRCRPLLVTLGSVFEKRAVLWSAKKLARSKEWAGVFVRADVPPGDRRRPARVRLPAALSTPVPCSLGGVVRGVELVDAPGSGVDCPAFSLPSTAAPLSSVSSSAAPAPVSVRATAVSVPVAVCPVAGSARVLSVPFSPSASLVTSDVSGVVPVRPSLRGRRRGGGARGSGVYVAGPVSSSSPLPVAPGGPLSGSFVVPAPLARGCGGPVTRAAGGRSGGSGSVGSVPVRGPTVHGYGLRSSRQVGTVSCSVADSGRGSGGF